LSYPTFYLLGFLVKKIFDITAEQQQQYPDIQITCLPEMGIQQELLQLLREREIETQLGQVQMNCEMCKFRLAAVSGNHDHDHHDHAHDHHHHHDHEHPPVDPYAKLEDYHQRIWNTP
jgi:ABC-type Zn2+ transport system, periplasmic component/surface adhesin